MPAVYPHLPRAMFVTLTAAVLTILVLMDLPGLSALTRLADHTYGGAPCRRAKPLALGDEP
jgi:hypothetical protein